MMLWKKRVCNLYNLMGIILLPVLTFAIFILIADFFSVMHGEIIKGRPVIGNGSYLIHLREAIPFVQAMDWFVADIRNFLPLLSGLIVIPFIQIRDRFLPFAQPRLRNGVRIEYTMIAQTVVLSGGVVLAGYLLTMLWTRCMFVDTYQDACVYDSFVQQWGWNVSAEYDPYLFVLLYGLLRCFLMPMVFSLLTIGVSYLTNKIYLYLLIPTIYNFAACSAFAQGNAADQDKWPLPLFSPENFIALKSPEYWQFGHNVHGIWGVVCASLLIIVPSLVMIWWGMRRRRE